MQWHMLNAVISEGIPEGIPGCCGGVGARAQVMTLPGATGLLQL